MASEVGSDAERGTFAQVLRVLRIGFELALEVALAPWVIAWAVIARFLPRRFDVGIGPSPMVTHKYLKSAFERVGYSCETFVSHTYFITNDFDINLESFLNVAVLRPYLRVILTDVRLFVMAVRRYRCLFLRFDGGPMFRTRLLRRIEPWLLKVARVRVIICGYGGDVQDQLLGKNLNFKHAVVTDYPRFKLAHRSIESRMRTWTRLADFVIGGCDWVDYMYHWDMVVLADWCIDVPAAAPVSAPSTGPLRVLHAPNHTTIKGTSHLQRAIDALKAEGHAIELVLVQKVPNARILELIDEVDLIADQFVIGMYGFFAVEAMARGKPVMAYLDPRYLDLFTFAGLIDGPESVPVIQTSYREIAEQLRWALAHRAELPALGARGREFVRAHHSIEARSAELARAMARIGLQPNKRAA